MPGNDLADMAVIENRTFDEISIGDSATIVHTLSRADIELFAVVSGDLDPAHLDEQYAAANLFHHVIAHGMWGGALVSAVLGTRLPDRARSISGRIFASAIRSVWATRSP
jgi:acyl dehydratase